jgi:hypothetical protein
VLRAWRADAPERLSETTLGRRFEPDDEGGKRTVADTTIPAGGRRDVRVRVASLGGAAGEPVRLELRLVYTIDEFPFRGREVAEATSVTMFSDEVRVTSVPDCGAAPLTPPPSAGDLSPRSRGEVKISLRWGPGRGSRSRCGTCRRRPCA